MLLTKDLIEGVDEKYIPMLKMVNIPDFTKCIAQFSGLEINWVSENVVKNYLLTWAKNKYRFFKLLGDNIRLDIPFEYNHLKEDIQNELKDIAKTYPVYSYWLDEFRNAKTNKITSIFDFDFRFRNKVDELFPQYRMSGSTITHFFKGCLNAPDDLVTRLAAIFENQKIKATYTMSIDPVDMMLASENPYDWTSCYRLEQDREDSHADGCMAAILDTNSLISYVWNNEGKFTLYGNYQFKNIRYKRMRQWLAISPKMTSIHFNMIYPGKTSYEESFEKQLRCIVEGVVARHLGVEDRWKKHNGADCWREYYYGYSEYDRNNVWKQVDAEEEEIVVYDTEIYCPDGCGNVLPGSQSDYEDEYNGQGFICENYEERYYCEIAGEYCDHGGEDCEDCWHWRNEHPICDIEVDDEYECENPDSYYVDDGLMQSCSGHCKNCPRWREHHPDEENETDLNKDSVETATVSIGQLANAQLAISETPDERRYTLNTYFDSASPLFSINSEPIAYTFGRTTEEMVNWCIDAADAVASSTTAVDRINIE